MGAGGGGGAWGEVGHGEAAAAAAWAAAELGRACEFCGEEDARRHRGLALAGVARARERPMQFARGRLLRLDLRLEYPAASGVGEVGAEVVVFEEAGPPARFLGYSLRDPLFAEEAPKRRASDGQAAA